MSKNSKNNILKVKPNKKEQLYGGRPLQSFLELNVSTSVSEHQLAKRVIELEKEKDEAKVRVKHLENAIYMSAEESMVEGQGHFCRYCLKELNEYSEGHKKDCVYLSCVPLPKKRDQ